LGKRPAAAVTIVNTKSVAPFVVGKRSPWRNRKRQTKKIQKKKRKKRKRENENLSTTKILQDVNRRFVDFHESISEKEEKKKEKERVRGVLSQSMDVMPQLG